MQVHNFKAYKSISVFESPYKGIHFSNRSKNDSSDGDDPLEGLEGVDEDVDFTEFSEPEEQ